MPRLRHVARLEIALRELLLEERAHRQRPEVPQLLLELGERPPEVPRQHLPQQRVAVPGVLEARRFLGKGHANL